MEVILKDNERIDDLQLNNLKIIQNKDGFCFGIDSVILSEFAKDIKNNSKATVENDGATTVSAQLIYDIVKKWKMEQK